MPGKVYRTAIYCRLSREDGDKVESNSIASQRAICEDYIARHDDLEIVCEPFVDDGYSGVSFNRPNFKKLEDAIRKGAIDCVVVKDLSRFSRNYIDGGRYLEKIFPQLGIRFIAVNDAYDSLTGDPQSDSFVIPFKNLINDSYCKDISMKIRSSLEVKQKNGEFVGAFAPYGYKKSPDNKKDFFDCSLHRKDKEKCKGHFIRVKVLDRVVLKHIQAVTGYILRHEAHFRAVMEEQLRLESGEQIRIRRKRLERNENRIAELKRLFIRIYEDNASGRLSDDRFDMLSLTYETEQKQLEAECITLRQEIEVQERQNENIEKFIQTAHKYVGIDELDGYALRELVSAIYVDAPDKSSGKRVQHIHIKYDGLGFIPLNELMKEETA